MGLHIADGFTNAGVEGMTPREQEDTGLQRITDAPDPDPRTHTREMI